MIRENLRWMAALTLAANLAFAPAAVMAAPGGNGDTQKKPVSNVSGGGPATSTPIKHLVVIFQENESFDHYFGTYPNAENPKGETKFKAKSNTPAVNGLSQGLLERNPNSIQPFRLDPSQNYTCSQNHDYMPEQQAFDSGLMDKFPESTATPCSSAFPTVQNLNTGIVMGYYDGNTVTALWNYAQNFAMSDNSFDTNFGPSTVGAVNVVSGMTGGVDPATVNSNTGADEVTANSIVGDPDPFYDDCGAASNGLAGMVAKNKNIGMLLSAKGISWGWFQGGFTPSSVVNGKAVCATTTNRIDGTPEAAYSAHHNPFEYYQLTSNPHHLAPKNLAEVGHDGQANHQYDLSFFKKAALAGGLPSVSYLKANRANDGHPSNSSPLDEQVFLVDTINFLQTLPEWSSTAVIIAWDDSDGWYDHVMSPIINPSNSVEDALTGTGSCGNGGNALESIQARCGYGARLPFLVISLYARTNYVDSTLIDQSSVVRFIEENWDLPQIGNGSFDEFSGTLDNMFNFNSPSGNLVFLDPSTGQVVSTQSVPGSGN